MLPTYSPFSLQTGIVFAYHFKATKRFAWLEDKKKNPSVLSKMSQMSALPPSPHQALPQRRASAHTCVSRCKGRLLCGVCFYRLYQSTSGEGVGAADGVFPFTAKVTSNVAVSGRWHLVEVRPSRQFYHWQETVLIDTWIYKGFICVCLCMFAVEGGSPPFVSRHFLQWPIPCFS